VKEKATEVEKEKAMVETLAADLEKRRKARSRRQKAGAG